jgi:hypothetical protein
MAFRKESSIEEKMEEHKMNDVMNKLTTSKAQAPVSEHESGLAKYSFEFKDEILESKIFLPGSSLTPDGIWISPLCICSDLLRIQGIPSGNLRVAMATLLTCNSAHTGNPLGEEITESGETGAASMLGACLNLTPAKAIIEMPKFTTETILRERDQIRFRTIIGFDGEGYRKENRLLNLLLELQVLKNQETLDTKYSKVFEEVTVQGPTSLIVINKNPTLPILTNPSFLHLYMNPEASGTDQPLFLEKKFDKEMYFSWVRASLERLQPHPVMIPFMEQLTRHLVDSKVKYSQQKAETLSRMLSVVVLTNNPPPLWKSEVYGRLFGNDVARTFSKNIRPDHPQTEALVATKVDYFLLWSFMDDLWLTGEESLTDRQLRVFNAIKKRNIEHLDEKVIDTKDPIQLIIYLSKNQESWATIEKIFEYVNRDGSPEEVSMSTLYREIRALTEKQAILTKKDSKEKNRVLFSICTLKVGRNIKLPHPSKIRDGIFDKEPVKVVNPITGKLEVIEI